MTALSKLLQDVSDNGRIVFGQSRSKASMSELAESAIPRFSDNAQAGSIGIMMTNDRPTVEVLLGAVLTGSRLVSLPIPPRGMDILGYAAFLKSACETSEVDRIVVRDDYAELLRAIGLPAIAHGELSRQCLARPGGAFEFVQFSSGTTGDPKAVVLDDELLGANIEAILSRLGPRKGDVTVSWLPLSHDLGLVGMLLSSAVAGGRGWVDGGVIVLLDPVDFLRRPDIWLRAMSEFGASVTGSPDFAYRRAMRCGSADLDLSTVRAAIVGGDVVRGSTLGAFEDRFAGVGWQNSAFCPAYGMAEIGLAASLTSPDELWKERVLDLSALAGHQVLDREAVGPGVVQLGSSGTALTGYSIEAASPNEGIGPVSIVTKFAGRRLNGTLCADSDYRVATGDVGFTDAEGTVFIVGRSDDYLVVNGQNIFAPHAEAAVSGLEGVKAGRVGMVKLVDGRIVMAVESEAPAMAACFGELDQIRSAVLRSVGIALDEILLAEPNSLPFTSSGKLQRRELSSRIVGGKIASLAGEGPGRGEA